MSTVPTEGLRADEIDALTAAAGTRTTLTVTHGAAIRLLSERLVSAREEAARQRARADALADRLGARDINPSRVTPTGPFHVTGIVGPATAAIMADAEPEPFCQWTGKPESECRFCRRSKGLA
jgi:hypothetical protein